VRNDVENGIITLEAPLDCEVLLVLIYFPFDWQLKQEHTEDVFFTESTLLFILT
jgi:hypothetical protein